MTSKFIIAVFFIFFTTEFHPAKARTWIRAGYWHSASGFPISEINSSLFTHLLYAFAGVDSTSYKLSSSPSDEKQFSHFTDTVKEKNPSVATLLSIGGPNANNTTISIMVSNVFRRKTFIDSSIRAARLHGFQGLDFWWVAENTRSDMLNMADLFKEWRAATELEAGKSGQAQLILTATVGFTPNGGSFHIKSMERYLDWVNVMAFDYFTPQLDNFTGAPAALYDPASTLNTDYGIKAWITGGLTNNKLVLGLPFYGYAWTLENTKNNGIGARATKAAFTEGGDLSYKDIKKYIQTIRANVMYNATYAVNYCTIGTSWIGFDDIEAVKTKVSYAKEKKLLGYFVWQVAQDDNWTLSQAAAQVDHKNGPTYRWRLLAIVFPTAAAGILLGSVIYYYWIRKRKPKGTPYSGPEGDFNCSSSPNLKIYRFRDIEAATNRFSFENKLGQGGYGPVYKGILPNGQEIAVKKLSKTSTQGNEEFKNEVMLTASLQHVNLVRLLGFCTDREEPMLIYEYMPNKSLDCYLFDLTKQNILDWRKRVHIIEGVTQGLLYLQEYSRMTVIHRDLKASNILLDKNMKPKISDFGLARIFEKDELEANTGRVAGTYGFVPPEYVKRGIYSAKSDVYSFGVLVLEILSGKKVSFLYGADETLSLLDYAYQLWKSGKGMEFMDPSLDDTDSSCKLTRCMQIALLCVQENPNDRPSMLEVSSMLKNETTYINIPNNPAFSKQSEEQQKKSTLPCSVNDVTISEVAAR